jgi:Fe-S cluster assembly iron-binding protein IscA
MGSFVLNWSRDEPDDITRARALVEEHDRKERLTRVVVFAAGCAAMYLGLRLSEYIVTRDREDGEPITVEEIIPMEHIYSE